MPPRISGGDDPAFSSTTGIGGRLHGTVRPEVGSVRLRQGFVIPVGSNPAISLWFGGFCEKKGVPVH